MPPKKSFPLRIDPELFVVLERWAADEFRSINAHIEFLLRDAAVRAGRISKKRMSAIQDAEDTKQD